MEPKNLLLRLPAIQASKKRSWEKNLKAIQSPEPYKTLTFTSRPSDFYTGLFCCSEILSQEELWLITQWMAT